MRRLALAAALLAATAVATGGGTLSAFSDTRANAFGATAQSPLPPLNTAPPTVTRDGLLVTGTTGSWNLTNAPTTSHTARWVRCSGGDCSYVSGVLSIVATLVYTLTGADAGSTIHLEVTATDSSITPTAPSGSDLGVRAATTVRSAGVAG